MPGHLLVSTWKVRMPFLAVLGGMPYHAFV